MLLANIMLYVDGDNGEEWPTRRRKETEAGGERLGVMRGERREGERKRKDRHWLDGRRARKVRWVCRTWCRERKWVWSAYIGEDHWMQQIREGVKGTYRKLNKISAQFGRPGLVRTQRKYIHTHTGTLMYLDQQVFLWIIYCWTYIFQRNILKQSSLLLLQLVTPW